MVVRPEGIRPSESPDDRIDRGTVRNSPKGNYTINDDLSYMELPKTSRVREVDSPRPVLVGEMVFLGPIPAVPGENSGVFPMRRIG
jgi:hypothetical protein